jgi:DNA-binding transcriptional ArsR family regulator
MVSPYFRKVSAARHRYCGCWVMILCQLANGELSVGQLQPRVGLSQSALSQHLALLREENIVATRRDGQMIHYRIADTAALRVIATLAELFCPPDPGAPQ